MNMLRLSSLGLLTLLLLCASTSVALSEESSSSSAPGASACSDTVNKELAKEQRYYRAVLLGHPKAKNASVGDVRYDDEGNAWIKTEDNKWKSAAKDKEKTTWKDSEMDKHDEMREDDKLEDSPGIFETKRVLTSDLIPYLIQSFRALQCRIDMICRTVDLSINQKKEEGEDSQKVRVGAMGCIEEELEIYPSCQLSAGERSTAEEGDALGYCTSAGREMLAREEDLLRVLVEYDAAYRSLLQLAGSLDLFMGSFEWPVGQLLRQTAGILGYMQRIPCFIATCDPQPPGSSASTRIR